MLSKKEGRPAVVQAEGSTPLNYTRGSETVLLVEDEELLRKAVTELLDQIGYKVLTAANGEQAIRVSRDYSDKIHLLITDVVMPGKAGPELARQLCAMRPDLKVIFISGYDDGSLAPNGVLTPGTVLVSKPFSVRALSAKMREVLDKN